ncbi:trypsin-like peptidase domain-containing protein [Streptomyces sp. DSM 110735]|uniref:trypsin-like peptidase domain-containing protein n=1 Tax=Streptomyces sp. DSM 110735 TaxID=2775031 RepID=UPI0018F3117C|nr:trypsin-like peptidase domain-containing protein [Streptomyces sp. DSM 110735]
MTERDTRPHGSGFLIDESRVLTCAHVVESAWSKDSELWVAFPKADEAVRHRIRVAEVTLPSGDDREIQDVAVLHLTDSVPAGLAARLRSPLAEDLVGADWWSFGFPDGVLGNSVNGNVGEALGYGWMRLDSLTSRYPVKGGYSGSAVWSPTYQAVVGMVGQAHSATGDARALTMRAIDKMLPGQELQRLIDWSLEASDETALTSWGWSLDTDPEAGRHWHPRARGVSTAAERGFRFRGRVAALQEIIKWITGTCSRRQALVVTGAPGSGKSAVLGRIITTADREVAAALPPDDTAVRAPLGSISCAVHAKGKTALEVAQEIACAASAPLPNQVVDLLPALRASLENRLGGPFTLIVDALDEASSAGEARIIVNHIIVPLVETCADLQVRVVVGTRHRDDAGDLLSVFGRSARVVNLDAPDFTSVTDLTAYALATLRLQGDERVDNPYSDILVARPVAERIATLADGNYLVAGLVARAHGMHDECAVEPRGMSFPVTVDSSLRAYLRLLPDVGSLSAENLLIPLAYAEAPGLTTGLWRTALTALFGSAPAESELFAFARSSAANFLVEAAVDGEVDGITFRLFHQALSDSLRTARADVASPVSDERALACAYIAAGAKTGWAAAPSYLLRSLAVHAGRGGVIDQLLAENEYPLYADLRRLVPQARLATTDVGRQRARLLRQTPRALDAPGPERAALFSVTEVQERLGTTYRDSLIAKPYQAVWSTVPPSMETAVLEGHKKEVHALCFLHSGGRGLLASAADDAIRLWDPNTGDTIQTFTTPGWIAALCAVTMGSHTLLAGAGLDGVLRIWEPEAGTVVRALDGHHAPIDQLCVLNVAGRALLASRGRDMRVKVWDPVSGEVVRTFRTRKYDINGMCAVDVEGRPLLALLTGQAGGRSKVRLWDPMTGETVHAISIDSSGSHGFAAVQCDAGLLFATGEPDEDDHVVALWDGLTGRAVQILEGGQGSIFELVDVHIEDRNFVAAGFGEDESGTVMIWDPMTGEETHRLEGHDGWAGALCAVESAGEALIASAGQDCTVRLWDLNNCVDPDQIGESNLWIGSLAALEGDGCTAVASSGRAGLVLVHDVASGRVIGQISSRHASVTSLCAVDISGHACLAIASRGTAGGAIQVWDSTTGGVIRCLEGPGIDTLCALEINGQPCLAFSSRENKVNSVSLWDLSADKVLRGISAEEGLIRGLCALDCDGRRIVAILTGYFGIWPGEFDGAVVSLWDAVDGGIVDSFEVPDASLGSMSALYGDDRTLLAVVRHQDDGEDDMVGTGSVWVFDPANGRRVGERDLHSGWVSAVSPVEYAGRTGMASAGQTERAVRLWVSDDLRQMMEIPVRREVFSVVQVGEYLVFGLDNGGVMTVRLGAGGEAP